MLHLLLSACCVVDGKSRLSVQGRQHKQLIRIIVKRVHMSTTVVCTAASSTQLMTATRTTGEGDGSNNDDGEVINDETFYQVLVGSNTLSLQDLQVKDTG